MKYIKHIIKEGSREHVISWSSFGAQCSCANCEINKKKKIKLSKLGKPLDGSENYGKLVE